MSRWTWHGGGLAAAKAHFGDGPLPWIDLSTGINPHPWPGAGDVVIDWHRLPDEGTLAGLEAAAARYFGTDAANVCAVPGTEIGLRLFGETLTTRSHYLIPSYRTHSEMVDGAIPVGAVDCAEGQTLILANPNNPDGRVLSQTAVLDLLDRRKEDRWLVIDEAFADATPEVSVAGYIRDDRRLVIFRSFGKFFGLAGLRLGFMLGPSMEVARMRKRLGAWPVSAAAIAIGTAAYGDACWIDAARSQLRHDAKQLDAMLARAGHSAKGDCPLFRLIDVADADATFRQLARQSILVRPFEDHPHWLRLGLPKNADELARLEAALHGG
jgi:cobalamin biosynthetic protein CobC